jgi:hypothetical protein
MKKSAFILLFIAIQLFLIFFYIHHQSTLIKLSFEKQKNEKKKVELTQKKQTLTHALHANHDLAAIKDFAVQSSMQKITLAQVKTVPMNMVPNDTGSGDKGSVDNGAHENGAQ